MVSPPSAESRAGWKRHAPVVVAVLVPLLLVLSISLSVLLWTRQEALAREQDRQRADYQGLIRGVYDFLDEPVTAESVRGLEEFVREVTGQ